MTKNARYRHFRHNQGTTVRGILRDFDQKPFSERELGPLAYRILSRTRGELPSGAYSKDCSEVSSLTFVIQDVNQKMITKPLHNTLNFNEMPGELQAKSYHRCLRCKFCDNRAIRPKTDRRVERLYPQAAECGYDRSRPRPNVAVDRSRGSNALDLQHVGQSLRLLKAVRIALERGRLYINKAKE